MRCASFVLLFLVSRRTADGWSKGDCAPGEDFLEENVRFVGKCLEDVPTVKECYRRGIEVGVLTDDSRNDRFWGEVDDPLNPRGCIYVNGLVFFNKGRSSGKAIDCGIPNPRAICICKRTCYTPATPMKIEAQNRVRQCLGLLAKYQHAKRLKILFLGVSTLGQIWNEFGNADAKNKAGKCQHGIPQENIDFAPHSIDFHRWNFIAPAATELGHGKANEDIRQNVFCNLPTGPKKLLNKVEIDGKGGYSVFVIQVGAWDITWGNNPRAFETALDQNVRFLLGHAAIEPWNIILVTQTPEGHALVRDPNLVYGHDWASLTRATLELNKRIRKVAERYHTVLIDAYQRVMNHPNKSRKDFWENGGAGWHIQGASGTTRDIAVKILERICSPVRSRGGEEDMLSDKDKDLESVITRRARAAKEL